MNDYSIKSDLDYLHKRIMMMMFAVLSRQVRSDWIVLIERLVLKFNYQTIYIESHLVDVVGGSRPSKKD